MRVAGLHVEGFGILRDWRVDDLGAGLSVFYGPNEAGKSTLLAFLRGVLFGFPDGRSKEPKYEPVAGDAHGGRITLVGSNGPVVVERFAGAGRRLTLTLEDGAPGDAADLAERLGHADARLFRDVYAFGLTELQQLGALGDAGVQDHLFAAGVTGAGRSARRALRELRGAATELFAGVRSRKSDRARAIATEISSLRSQLLLRQEAALRYPDLVEAERGIALQLTALGAESLRARAQEQRARRLLELWAELFSPLSDAREQLSKLGPMRALGDDTGERLDRALGALEAARERRDQVRAEGAEIDEDLEALPLDEATHAVAHRVEALHEGLALHRRQRERRTELLRLEADCDQRVRSALAELGEAFSEDDLARVGSSLGRRDELRGWKSRLGEAELAARSGDAERRPVVGQRDRARTRQAELAERLRAAGGVSNELLDEREAALSELRALCERMTIEEVALRVGTESVAAHAASESLVPKAAATAIGVTVVWTLGAFALAAFGLHLAALGALVLLALAGGLWLQGGARRRRAQRQLQAEEHAELLDRSRSVESLREEARSPLALLGLAPPSSPPSPAAPSPETLDEVARSLRTERVRAGERDAVHREIEQNERDLDACERALREHDRAADAARAERAAAVRDFEAWKRASRLPEGLSADAALDFLEAARRGRDARDERERLASDRARIDRELAVWEEEARAVLEATGGADPATEGEEEGAALVEALAALRAQCEADRAARERRVPIERRRGAIAERLRASEAACESARGELAGFVEENGCRDVEELRERMGAARAARELEERARALELELDRRLDAQGQSDEGDASGGDGSGLREQLASGRTAEWEEHITAARAEIAALEEQRDELIRRQHDAANARSRLEASTEVAELELHRAALEQELREVVGEWRRLRLASGLVESTLERFERERQPNVLREASRLFARITDERYPRIVQTGERAASGKSAGFAVQGPGGALRGPETLSRGTREQLYLCLRLGLVTELERRGTSLPIVMDDVLVNFDDERATAAAALLAEFAAGHQILFFTCASRTRDLLASAGRDVDVRALGDT